MDSCSTSVRASPFDCLIFDLNDTLYPTNTGISEALKKNIDVFLVEKFGFPENKASSLRVELFKKYGSSLAGLRAVKEKIQDMNTMRKAKAEAKAEEKAENEVAKARMDIAHEVRLAKESEAAMDMHVVKAAQRAEEEMAKHAYRNPNAGSDVNSSEYATMEAANDPTYTAT